MFSPYIYNNRKNTIKTVSAACGSGKSFALRQKIKKNQQRIFYTTDEPQHFQELGNKLLGLEMSDVKKIKL